MPQFILFIRENLSRYPIPEQELKNLIDAHVSWAKELSARGVFRSGNGIKSEGRLLEMVNHSVIVQPPRDVKEGIGGYYIIEADNLDAAVDMAKTCPTFSAGDKVEVRELGV